MMTFTIHWWYLDIAFILAAGYFGYKRHGDWDFTGELIAIGFIIAAIAHVLGHFF